jgi:hypothetical protein
MYVKYPMSYIMINIMPNFFISLYFWNNQSAQIITFLYLSQKLSFLSSPSFILTLSLTRINF